jgi:glycosyltransferase involved in cell wall biosynthesis
MLSIILPCYNEKDNLSALFERLDLLVKTCDELEIVLVNNGSNDGSEKVFEQEVYKRNNEIFKIVHVKENKGYGFGILSGLRAAKGDVLAVTHADRQTDPMDVLKAYEIFRSKGDLNLLVKGFRKNRKISEAVFSYCMGLLASMVLGERLTEINAQPKLFSKSFFDKYGHDAPNDFSLDLYLLYQAKKHGQIIDFPVYFSKRVAGEAKGGSGSSFKVKWKLIKRSFSYIFELKRTLTKYSN